MVQLIHCDPETITWYENIIKKHSLTGTNEQFSFYWYFPLKYGYNWLLCILSIKTKMFLTLFETNDPCDYKSASKGVSIVLCKAVWGIFTFISCIFYFLRVLTVNITAFIQLLIFRFLAFYRQTNNYKSFIFTIIYFIMILVLILYSTILINKYNY